MNPASSWVEELEEKPEINEFGQITPSRGRSLNQTNMHHHHQQPQQHQQQAQNELGGNGSTGNMAVNGNQAVNGGHNGQIHQSHIHNQFQSNHATSSWYPYSYSTNQNRDSFSSSLITYSENNNVIGIS